MSTPQTVSDTPRRSRRAVAAGAMWSVPVLAMATEAPAFAASCLITCASVQTALNFGTNITGNNWVRTTTSGATWSGDQAAVMLNGWNPGGAGSGNTCYPNCPDNAAGLTGRVVLFGGDSNNPPANQVYTSGLFCLERGVTYTFTIPYTYYGCSGNAVTLRMDIISSTATSPYITATSQAGTSITAPVTGGSANGTASFTMSGDGEQHRFRFMWVFAAKTASGCDYNDIGFNRPSVTCSP